MRPMTLLLMGAIRLYQLFISPALGPRCRFTPGCSAYAMEAIDRHGPLKGTGFALRRLARCHPWGGSGYDPVPECHGHNHATPTPVTPGQHALSEN